MKSKSLNLWDIEETFIRTTRLQKVQKYGFFGIMPCLKRVWNAENLIERMLATNIIEEKQVNRGPSGKIITVFFRELPKMEHVEIACLGFKGIEELENDIKKGVV